MSLKIKAIKTVALAALTLAPIFGRLWAASPPFDNSGNSLLSGTYNFRRVIFVVGNASGDLSRTIAVNGSMVFDGAGNYSIPAGATDQDSAGLSQTTSAVTGTYTLSAAGYGFLSSPIIASGTSDTLYFVLSSGIIVGSTTENGYNDLLIAGKLSSPAPSNATLQGSWSMAGFFPGASASTSADAFFQLTADGSGNVSGLSVPGYFGGSGASIQTQTVAGFSASFNNGTATLNFPASASPPIYFSGQENLSFSPDGNFVFGGSPDGYDMIVGVRNGAAGTSLNFSGLYYQAGIDRDFSQYSASGFANLDTYYGSLSAGGGSVIAHERLESVFYAGALGSTFTDSYPSTLVSPYNDAPSYIQFAYGSGGKYRIGAGTWPFPGINIAVQAPEFTGSGVYLNPTGVVNSASSAPFTAGVSAGELITLYGSNLAAGTVVASTVPLPTALGGVQVSINGVPAPIYYVSAGQISVLVPYAVNSTAGNVARIQVTNNGTPSNAVTTFVFQTTPGAFTVPAGGIGPGAIVHSNGALVTAGNPALPGELVIAFVTGLGEVSTTVQDGSAGPYPGFAYAQNNISVEVGGVPASTTCQYCLVALAPGEIALYQINLQLPETVPAGETPIAFSGTDSYAAEASIPIGSMPASPAAANAAPSAASAARARDRSPRIVDAARIAGAGAKIRQAPFIGPVR